MQFENNSYFIIPGNAILVDGVERSIIYDLNRMDYDILPKELSLAIAMAQGSFQHLFSLLDEADHDFYVPFVNELVNKDYLIPIDQDELQYFTKMDLAWHYPYKISNAIIEYSKHSNFSLKQVFAKLDEVNCQGLEIRLCEEQDFSFFEHIKELIDGRIFRQMDFLIKYKEGQDIEFLKRLKMLHPIFLCITQYEAPEDLLVKDGVGEFYGVRMKTADYKTLINDHIVHPDHFYINREFFIEAQNHNINLNGKIVITKEGMIKCAVNHPKTFGNIMHTSIPDLLEQTEFSALWGISKDKIIVCKDCEYRYMCNDTRIPVKNKNGEWTYSESCNYDPYTCKWHNMD